MKVSLSLVLCLLSFATANAQQPALLWHQNYSADGEEEGARGLCNTPDGGVLLVGQTRVHNGIHDGWVVWVDTNGDTVRTRRYGGGGHDILSCVVPIPEGGYIMAGFSTTNTGGDWDLWILRITETGDVVAENRFGEPEHDYALRICRLTDGDFEIATASIYGLVRVNDLGVPQWSSDVVYDDVQATSDGGYVAARKIEINPYNYYGIELTKFNAANAIEWTQQFEDNYDWEWIHGWLFLNSLSLAVSPDGAVALSAAVMWDGFFSGLPSAFAVIKTDALGNPAWQHTLQLRWGNGGCAIISNNNGFALAGFAYYGNDGGEFLALLSPEGNLLTATYSNQLRSHLNVVQTADGGYAVAGENRVPALDFGLNRYSPAGVLDDASGYVRRTFVYGWNELELVWSAGAISRFALTGFCFGTTASVVGDAAVAWAVLPNGDGNDGDSIIFEASIPLTAGAISTFILNYPEGCSTPVQWQVGTMQGYLDRPLPVELLSFEAEPGDASVTLHWSTASETDNDYFEIIRDNSVVHHEPSGGSGSTEREYVWTDRDVENGVTYQYSLYSISNNGERQQIGTTSATPAAPFLPLEPALYQNYPNPFNSSTTITFDLTEVSRVHLAIYDVSGRLLQVLADREFEAGGHQVPFRAVDLPSGIYFYRLQVGEEFLPARKLLLLK